MASTRLPGKVLLCRTGKPLIQHVYEAASQARSLERVVIATDDQEVLSTARSFGAEAVLTSAAHPNGTSRLNEAADVLRLAGSTLIVNVQGDEPEVDPESIDAAVGALTGAESQPHAASIGTIAVPFQSHEDPDEPNCVKVVFDRQGRALYFSRSRIPYHRDAHSTPAPRYFRHVGLYAYRRSFLRTYAELAQTPLEQAEQLEQLRALEHGYRIAVAIRAEAHPGIDTPEQYEAFVRRYLSRSA